LREAIPNLELTVTADGALIESRAVGFDGAQISTAGAAALGFARSDYADGLQANVIAGGVVTAESGAAVAVGDALELDAQGRVVTQDTGTTVAHALTAATGAGEFARIIIKR